MARLFAFVLGILAATLSYAQERPRVPAPRPPDGPATLLTHRAYKAAQEINRQSRTLTSEEIAQLNGFYDAIHGVLIAGSQPPAGQLVCVSRDDDGFHPYLLAVRTGDIVQKLPGSRMNSLDDCQATVKATRALDALSRQVFACVTRDDDGVHPYQLAIVDLVTRSLMKMELAVARDRESCERQVKDVKVTPTFVRYCGSKGNDGLGPWVATGRSRHENSANGISQDFSSYEDCVAQL